VRHRFSLPEVCGSWSVSYCDDGAHEPARSTPPMSDADFLAL